MKSDESVGLGDSGWRADPTGRHEGRYFAAGHATDLVRDGVAEGIDPEGEHELEEGEASPLHGDYVGSSDGDVGAVGQEDGSTPNRVKWPFVLLALTILLVAGGGVLVALARAGESSDDRYLEALRVEGLAGQFPSDANAVAHGKQVCADLESGGDPQGLPVDKVAVDVYCPSFLEGFHVLETVDIEGSITLIDTPTYSSYYSSLSSIESYGGSCQGTLGFSDITPGVQVTVKNGAGDILTTTTLERGRGSSTRCTLPFNFTITEGEDRYVVTISHRGDLSYSFSELKTQGVQLSLGE